MSMFWNRIATGCLSVALAIGLGAPCSVVQATGLLIADGGLGGLLEIRQHDVRVTINNGIAVTEIDQVFFNTESRIVEALYTFPVPAGASISNFSMIIDGKEMIGEVVEKRRARQIYESYKQTRRDPGLLEQVDFKSFELRIFPIQPGAEQHIQITYYQQLAVDHDWANYVYPLATTTRPGLDQKVQGRFSFNLEIKNEIPITALTSPSHPDDLVFHQHRDNFVQASIENSGGSLDKDIVIAMQTKRPRTGLDVVTSRTPGEDGYFLMSLTAGEELAEQAIGMDYVFVVDISGSMANDRKLQLSRQACQSFIGKLTPGDRFQVLTFNIGTAQVFDGLQFVTEESVEQAVTFLDSRRARGGTSLRPAIEAAWLYRDADRPLNVVVLSDGMTETREQRELMAAIEQGPAGSRVFCVGIGNDVNRPLLDQMARDAGGLAAFVSHDDDFQRQATAFQRKLMRPAIKNVQIRFAGGDIYDVMPGKLPDLFHGSPLQLTGRYRQAGAIDVAVSGEIQGQAFEKTITVNLPDSNPDNPEIERLWAWHQVQSLMNQVRSNGESAALVDRIVTLCEGYSIASQYASFIVLENDAEFQRWKIQRRNATRIQRDRQARSRLRDELDSMKDLSSAGPQESTPPGPGQPVSQSRPQSPPERVNGPASPGDLDLIPSPGPRDAGSDGGGALDPISALIAAGLGAAGLARRRRGPSEKPRPGNDSTPPGRRPGRSGANPLANRTFPGRRAKPYVPCPAIPFPGRQS